MVEGEGGDGNNANYCNRNDCWPFGPPPSLCDGVITVMVIN